MVSYKQDKSRTAISPKPRRSSTFLDPNLSYLNNEDLSSCNENSEAELEKLKKTLKYKDLFRKSKRFPNKGYTHFFLSQELKPVDNVSNDVNHTNGNSIVDDSGSILSHSPNPTGLRHSLSVKTNNHESSTTLSTLASQSQPQPSIHSSIVKKNVIYNLSFSHDGKYLASAGDDGIISVWEVISSTFDRETINVPTASERKPRRSFIENALDETIGDLSSMLNEATNLSGMVTPNLICGPAADKPSLFAPVFKSKPIRQFHHDDAILSIDWSKNNFLLSSSEDKTVKLWHVDRADCLHTYQFDGFVTSVQFHKTDDRFFISAQWDGRVVFHSILEKQVVYETVLDKQITCVDFSPDSTLLFVGCDKGYLYILDVKGLVKVRDYLIKRKKRTPRITGIETFAEDNGDIKVLMTTNDSKVRLFNYSKECLEVRYSGYTNKASSIKATFNEDHNEVITGSEDGWGYIWQLYADKKKKIDKELSAINKVPFELMNIFKDDNCIINNKFYGSFHFHHSRCNAAIFAPRASLKLLELSNDPIFDLKNQYSFYLKEAGMVDGEIEDLSTAIIVSTDNNGTIRIFRRDFAYYVRKAMHGKKTCTLIEKKNAFFNNAAIGRKMLAKNSMAIHDFDLSKISELGDTLLQHANILNNTNGDDNSRGRKEFQKELRPANKFAVESGTAYPASSAIPKTCGTSPTNTPTGSTTSTSSTKFSTPMSTVPSENNRKLLIPSYSPTGRTGFEINDDKSTDTTLNSHDFKSVDAEIRRLIDKKKDDLSSVTQVISGRDSTITSSSSSLPSSSASSSHTISSTEGESKTISKETTLKAGKPNPSTRTSASTFACANCKGVNFTARPMNTANNNEIKFYCDDCRHEVKL